MNSRERFLTAMTGGMPDRVPCAPDISSMIPCRLTGKPFWNIWMDNDPPLYQAYLSAVEYFGFDAYFVYGGPDYHYDGPEVTTESTIISRSDERVVQRGRVTTPSGVLTSETTFFSADSPTPTQKLIKDLREDYAKLRHLWRMPAGYSTETAAIQKKALKGKYAFGTQICPPGFQNWMNVVQGGIEPLAVAEYEGYPELLEEWREMEERILMRQCEMIIDSKMFDYVLLGASGLITLASPRLFDKYAFPAIQKVTRLCKQAGMPTMLHSCGKEMYVVERCATASDLNCINPLEVSPMGDCDLAQVKRLYGGKLALMGNLHTTEVMLRGSVEDVKKAARKAIDDAAAGGGFILSTGDQCGRDTPDENIRAMVEVASTYGVY